MRVLREALVKEFGYRPDLGEPDPLLNNLRDKLKALEGDNRDLREKLIAIETENQHYTREKEQFLREDVQKNKLILDLQNNISRLRNEIWRAENSKAPAQIFAFSLVIVVIILLVT